MLPFLFYYQHLERVSRSFSFCISALTSPAKEWVALSYLLLRVVDTIEDCVWDSSHCQYLAFQELKSFFLSPPNQATLITWLKTLPTTIPIEEQVLLSDLTLLLNETKTLPSCISQVLLDTCTHMIDGMVYFISHYQKDSVFLLNSLYATNQYCFFVAGIVGELLSYLFTFVLEDFALNQTILNQSVHFGLCLQKINILKDKAQDEARQHFYIASRQELRDSLTVNAVEALSYLKTIPIISGRSYRLFCAWSLFIGLASLKWIDKNWTLQQEKYRISSEETNFIVKHVNQHIDDNTALERLFYAYLPQARVPTTIKSLSPQQLPNWFTQIYPKGQSFIHDHTLNLFPI